MERFENFWKRIAAMLLAMMVIVGCSSQTGGTADEQSTEVRMEKPDALGMSVDSLNNQVQQEAIDALEASNEQLVAEAVEAIDQVNIALASLALEDIDVAMDALANATGKFEIILSRDPNLAFVPIDATVQTVDLVADLETIKEIKKAARAALKEDKFQLVREELANLASEIQITTVELPLATFPEATKIAAALAEKGDIEGAKDVLYTALNTLVVKEERIPLPILRAQALIDEAQKQDASDEETKETVLQLLENAEYQLILAEELGYGDKDEEYAALNQAIKELKKTVKEDSDTKGLFESLKQKLAAFRDRIS